jgi:hypothetical protein
LKTATNCTVICHYVRIAQPLLVMLILVVVVVPAAAAAAHTFGFQCHSVSKAHVQSHVSLNQQMASLCCIVRDIKYESIFWYLTMVLED